MNPCRIALLAVLAVALAGCGGSSDSTTTDATTTEAGTTAATTTQTATTTAATTTAAAATTAPATTTTAPATTTTAPAATTIPIRVVGGKPDGGIVRPSVDKGTHVVIVVTSDTADEVHVHGYDISADVEAGGTVRIPFVADTPGRFEVELENLGVELAELTVQ